MTLEQLKEDLLMFKSKNLTVKINGKDITSLRKVFGIEKTNSINESTGDHVWMEVEYLDFS